MPNIEEKQAQLEKEIEENLDISIINLIEYLIEKAIKNKVSDIHIDPNSDTVKVRFRIDGVLQKPFFLPKKTHEEIISRIKVLCKLRTDEHQTAQDGRFRYSIVEPDNFVDIRVSMVPTYYGENVVMRLLSTDNQKVTLKQLGFSDSDQEKIIRCLKKPHGMVLATGPTGSGKTTTLYSLINLLNSPDVSIVTIEDPIEYAIDDVEQIQVNTKNGLGFANGLRSILRQDPNIIMVGEIRDKETVGIAVNTALTGHLLLSTIHTNDALGTIPRLIDMGVEEYLISSTLSLVIGQRLVRKICTYCKSTYKPNDIDKKFLKSHRTEDVINLYRGEGCKKCGMSGYSGRISINEILVIDDKIREAIHDKKSSNELKKIALGNNTKTLLMDGLEKVISGVTTIDEILRVTNE
jgi:type II secretory ATPase GspE/PulE/Tfp pilus assembly ATPase PilB-like protein